MIEGGWLAGQAVGAEQAGHRVSPEGGCHKQAAGNGSGKHTRAASRPQPPQELDLNSSPPPPSHVGDAEERDAEAGAEADAAPDVGAQEAVEAEGHGGHRVHDRVCVIRECGGVR